MNKTQIREHLIAVSKNIKTVQLVNYFYDKYLNNIDNDFLLKSDRYCSIEEQLNPEIKIDFLLEHRFDLMLKNEQIKYNREKSEAMKNMGSYKIGTAKTKF